MTYTVKQGNHYWPLIIAIVLFLIGNVADYFYQADLHGWNNPLWENGFRAAKWGWFDFIPHDGWHISQTLRNTCDKLGAVIYMVWYYEQREWTTPVWIIAHRMRLAIPMITVFALYAITRGIGFSLIYNLLK